MKIFTVGIIIVSTLVLSSIASTPTTALQASSKGLKLYLTVDTNLNDDVIINTYQQRSSPDVDVDNQAQSQSQDNEQSESQSQNNNQEQTTTIINCPPDSRCVIEQ
jgi:hypothetical protein